MLVARNSIIGIFIPNSISLPASLFTRTVMHDPVTNHLVTLSSLWWCITEWAQRYLSVIRSDKSQSRSVSTQQTLSEIPVVHLYSHPVTLWRFYTQSTLTVSGSYTISWSKEEILDIEKALAKRTTRSCAMLRIGSCPSHHSPNDQWHPMSMVRKPWPSIDQRASQLEAH